METFELSRYHPIFSFASEVDQISSPVKRFFKLESFSYLKINSDLSRVHLSTNSTWNEFFYRNIIRYNQAKKKLISTSHWESGFSVLHQSDEPCALDARQHGIGSGVVVANPVANGTELCFFSLKSDASHATFINLLNNIDLLKRFVDYFKQVGSDLIKRAEKSPILVPVPYQTKEKKTFSMSKLARFEFLESLSAPTLRLLTERELECIKCLAQDMSAKQIAEVLSIREKTVVRHFENARNKYGFHKTSSLLKLFQ